MHRTSQSTDEQCTSLSKNTGVRNSKHAFVPNATFLSARRNATRKRGLCRRKMAGWLPHPGTVSKRLNLSSNFFSTFCYPLRRYQIQRGTLQWGGGVIYTAVGNIGDFRLKSPFISETVRDRSVNPWSLRNVNMKSYAADGYVSVRMTFSDL